MGDVLQVMEELALEARTMLVAMHEIGFPRHVGSRMLFMDGGRNVQDPPPQELIDNPCSPRTRSS